MFEFPKKQRLCNETLIKEMFSDGKSFATSTIRLVWFKDSKEDKIAIKSIIVVPKKKIKLAVKRNIVRRRMKEAYRMNKNILENILKINDLHLSIAIIYQKEKIVPYKTVSQEIKLILERLSKEI
tara:strand:- start:442 stop:816 length:375 start_codon:yes stop_codon:yes gene_type:complete